MVVLINETRSSRVTQGPSGVRAQMLTHTYLNRSTLAIRLNWRACEAMPIHTDHCAASVQPAIPPMQTPVRPGWPAVRLFWPLSCGHQRAASCAGPRTTAPRPICHLSPGPCPLAPGPRSSASLLRTQHIDRLSSCVAMAMKLGCAHGCLALRCKCGCWRRCGWVALLGRLVVGCSCC